MVYVANSISHRLGNPRANALPACQLRKLQRLVNGTQVSVPLPPILQRNIVLPNVLRVRHVNRPFWLDTLCIPVGEEYKNLRKKALGRMAATYGGSLLILVVDRHLMTMPSKSDVDTLGSLLLSSWVKRCWTFEEGCLSYVCNIQLADSARNPEKLDALYMRPTTADIWEEYCFRWRNFPYFMSAIMNSWLGTLQGRFALDRVILRKFGSCNGSDIRDFIQSRIMVGLEEELHAQLQGTRKSSMENRTGKVARPDSYTGKCIRLSCNALSLLGWRHLLAVPVE